MAWTKATIRLANMRDGIEVAALSNGPMAVHKCPENDDLFALTDVATGMRYAKFAKRKYAQAVGDLLVADYPSQDDPNKVDILVPRFRAAVEQCNLRNTKGVFA